jgi:hypothetical protein
MKLGVLERFFFFQIYSMAGRYFSAFSTNPKIILFLKNQSVLTYIFKIIIFSWSTIVYYDIFLGVRTNEIIQIIAVYNYNTVSNNSVSYIYIFKIIHFNI